MKIIEFWFHLIIYSQMPNEQKSIIDSEIGLAPTRRKAIIWTNDGLVYWHIYAPLGLKVIIPGQRNVARDHMKVQVLVTDN